MPYDSPAALLQSTQGVDPEGLSVPEAAYQNNVLGWAVEAVQEGDAFVKSQPGYEKIDEAIKSIQGPALGSVRIESLSATSTNRFSKIALDLAAGLTDIKPFWEYRTKNKLYDKQAEMFGNISLHWWLQRNIDLRFSDCIKYALVGGTGYTHHVYDPTLQDLDLISEDPRDVLPIRPGSYYSIQDAFGVVIRRERPTNWIKARYPRVADRIKPDRDASFARFQSSSRAGRILQTLGVNQSPFWAAMFSQRPAANMPLPVTDLLTIYVRDRSMNKTGQPQYLGDFDKQGNPNNNWSYVVAPKQPRYPRGRCIVLTRTTVIYDGPNIYWHGLFPVNKLTLDPWPWTWLGKAPLWDLIVLQRSLDKALRQWEDHNDQVAQPNIISDKNSVGRAALDRMNTRRAGQKFIHNPLAGKGIQIDHVPPLDPSIPQFIEKLTSEMEFDSGVRDLMGLTKLGQIPATETIEKIIENMSPANRGRSRVLEAFMRDFAMMTASNIMQFYTLPMRLAILGADGETWQDWDYDPQSLVPDFMGEELDQLGVPKPDMRLRGPRPRAERAQEFTKYFTFHVAPGSLLNSSEVTNQMKYIQLYRMGALDLETLLTKLNIPNVDQVMQRLAAQMQAGIGPAVGPAGSRAGRPASGQTAPRLVMKESP